MTNSGYETTIPVTLDQMIYHAEAVARAATSAFCVINMPFGSYGASLERSVENCCRGMKETGCQAVKVEGGVSVAPLISALVSIGVPVMGHIGFTPQAVNQLGGYRMQGRTHALAARVLDDAIAIEQAGAFATVLELVPEQLGALVSDRLSIPTLGVGAGRFCDGVALIVNDVIGLSARVPRHARPYADVRGVIRQAVEALAADVASGAFPSEAQATRMSNAEFAELESSLASRLA